MALVTKGAECLGLEEGFDLAEADDRYGELNPYDLRER